MLFIPYSIALHLVKKPLVTYAVIVICIVLHQFQWNNRHVIETQVQSYCHSINHTATENGSFDVFRLKYAYCYNYLIWMHMSPERDVITEVMRDMVNALGESSQEKIQQAIENANKNYQVIQPLLPESLDGQLMYYPDEFDLIRMITATFAHADWLHLVGNILFFFAFAQGVEGVINNKFKISVLFLALLITCHVAYAIYSSASAPVPTLGLSGVVMGMMGASFYLLPHARIKVFIWGYRFVNVYYIPAWILVVVYLGWDTVELYLNGNEGGINLVSHVSGGFAGLLFAALFFSGRRQAAKHELAEETDFQVSRKRDFNSYDVSSKYGRTEKAERHVLKQAVKDHEAFMQELYTLVSVQRDAEAMMLVINDYSRYQQDYGLLEQLFNRMSDWKKSRATLCTGRMLIDLLVNMNQYGRAVLIVKQCQTISAEFVLADPEMTLLLVRYAIELHETEVAYHLLHEAEHRYSPVVDVIPMLIKEAELCFTHLDKVQQGRDLVRHLLTVGDVKYKTEILSLGRLLNKLE